MVKIDNVVSMDFAKTSILALLSKSCMYSSTCFRISNSFCAKTNVCENDQNSGSFIKVSPLKVITSINLVLAKFRHWPFTSSEYI